MWTIWFLTISPFTAWALTTVPENDSSASLMEALSNFVGQLKPMEDKRQLEFERWCNGSLTAQSRRRDDLQRLLMQAMPQTELGERLPQLSHDIPALQAELTKEKSAVEALQGALRKSTREAELALQDGKKEYHALLKMQNWLNTKNTGHPKQLEKMKVRTLKLIGKAKAELQKREAALTSEKQSNADAIKKAKAIPQLQRKYENAKTEAEKLAQQRLVAERSTSVLLSALEDESQYLTELQGVCDIRKRLHDRIQAAGFSSLLKMAPQMQALMQHKQKEQTEEKEKEEKEPPKEAETTEENTATATVSTSAAPEVEEQAPVEVAKPKPTRKKAAKRAHHTAPRSHHAAPKASHAPVVTAPSVPPSSENQPAPVAIAPKASPQPKKSVSPKQTLAPQQPAPVAAAAVTEQAPPLDPADDAPPPDASPENAPPPVAPASKATHLRQPQKAPAPVPLQPVAEEPVAPPEAAPAVSDDSAPVPDKPSTPARLHAKKHSKASKPQKTKKNEFMDSAYAAAAGDLPAAYGAWKPDEEVSTGPAKPAAVNPSDAVKAMTSAFGDDSSSEMPILTPPTPARSKPRPKTAPATQAVPPPPPHPAPPASDPFASSSDTPASASMDASATDSAVPPSPPADPSADAAASDSAAIPTPPPPPTEDPFAESPPPKRKAHRHHMYVHHDEDEDAAPPPPPPAPMDNDDLSPPKSFRAPAGLEGGWKSMIGKTKAHKHHKDLDQEIMDKIGSGTPDSYTAWKPDDGSSPSPPPPAATPPSQAANDGDDGGPIGSADDMAALTGSPAPPPPAPKKRSQRPPAPPAEDPFKDKDFDDTPAPAAQEPPPAPEPEAVARAPPRPPAPPTEDPFAATPAVAEAAPPPEPADSAPAEQAAPPPEPAAADPAADSAPAEQAPSSSASLLQSTAGSKNQGKKKAAKKSDAWADMMSGLESAETEMTKPAPKKVDLSGAPAGSDAAKMMSLFSQPSTPAEPLLDAKTMANLPPPRIHMHAPPGLEGGWQAFMKKGKHKHHKYGDETDLMQNLDSTAPPQTYSAWKPGGAAAAAKNAAASEYAAAMKDFDSFLQTGMEMGMESSVARMLLAAARKPPAKKSSINLLEKSSSAASEAGESEERINVASLVLDAYSDILSSPPLHKLSQSHLDTPQLKNLWDKLQAVDPMTHPKASAGQKAQAEQWCEYFEENQQSAGQVLKDTQKWEKAESESAVAGSLSKAVMEEKQVREQLLGTLAQDRQVLTSLLQGEQHAFNDAAAQIQKWIQRADSELFSATGSEGIALHQAAVDALNVVANAQTEMTDMLELTISKRGTVEANQKTLLSQVTSEMQKAQADWQNKKHHEEKAKKVLDKAAKKFADVQKTCDKVLTSMEQRRHGGHREMSAIRTALLVLSDDV